MKKLGAEFILGVMILPFFAWIVSTVITLQNSYAELRTRSEIREETLKEIKEDVKFIREKLEER